ncbi:SPOR domain-containing protein [Glaciecola sp. 2405UD65-10]|uniref:SPOR domain-containing protein n=1 Tax=Glaciecola sp. 2405UD65-10 TaxID=3397244 RepID=UPI003B58F675
MKPHIKYKKLSALIASSCLLFSCSIIPDMSKVEAFLTNSQDESSFEMEEAEGITNAKPSPSIEEQTTSIDELKVIIAKQNQRWEEAQPAISRLIELEQDISFLTEQFGNLNPVPDYGSQYNVPGGFTASTEQDVLSSGSTVRPSFNTVTTPAELTKINEKDDEPPSKFSGKNSTMPSNVAVAAPAKPVMGNNLKQANPSHLVSNSNDGVDDAKFTGGKLTPDSKQEQCDTSNYTIGNGFAIHLASFKSRASVTKSWDDFKGKAADITCNKLALNETVSVKGQTFYSLRFGPYSSKQEALKTCSAIKTFQSYCGVTNFKGETF